MAIAKRMKLKNGTRRIVAAGRGRVIQSPVIRSEILKLVPKQKAPIHVVYLGTATYESTEGYNVQAAGFTEVGCTVEHLKLTHMRNSKENREMITQSLKRAQIVAVSGGNTLFALKKWRSLGVDKLLRNAMDDGVVLCGGSAGAICWFDAGHSDSRDPTTLLHVDPNLTEEDKKAWSYIRVTGLGLLPGLCCPHHDSTQSNGLPRKSDFQEMLFRRNRSGKEETGVGIDDQAAILVVGDEFRVLSTNGDVSKVTLVKYNKDSDSLDQRVFLPSEEMLSLKELL